MPHISLSHWASIGLLCLAALTGPATSAATLPSTHLPTGVQLDAQAAGMASYRLPNGFKIILAPFPSASTARVELLIKTGSKLEGYGETGMAHLLEHMLFKGAGTRSNLKSDLTALGAQWNGTTTADRTNYFETVAADPDKVDEVLRIEADRFIRPRFTAEDLSSEMTVVRNELERNDSEPRSVVMRALQRQSHFWHGYGRPTIGARSDIEKAPFSALQAFHRKHYRPDNAALLVSGRFDPTRVLNLAQQLFSAAQNPDTPPVTHWTREEPRPSTQRSELWLPAGVTLVASAWKFPTATDRSTQAADLALAAICDPDWGSLRKDLVTGRQLALTAFCALQTEADYSLLVAYASGNKDADAQALSQALSQHIETAATHGITAEQLERARQEELNAYERLGQSHETVATLLSRAEVMGDWRLLFWQRDAVKSIAHPEALTALKTWITPTHRSDVLLRHAEGATAAAFPEARPAHALVAGKDWPQLAPTSDPLPQSMRELARATTLVDLDDARGRAALISRKTQGDRVWLVLENDYGNAAAMSGRAHICRMASRLMAYGGNGLTRDELSQQMDRLQAQWGVELGGFTLEVPRHNLHAALKLLLATWSRPMLPMAEFERLRASTTAQIDASLNHPARLAATQVQLRLDNYPSGHPQQPRSLEQQRADNLAITYPDIERCVQDFLGIGHARLTVVGDLSVADVRALWQPIAALSSPSVPYARVADVPAPTRVDTTPIRVRLPAQPNATVTGTVALPVTSHTPDFADLRIAVKVLGGDTNSRIWKRLRETEGQAYGAGLSLNPATWEPRSLLTFYASAASEQADSALANLQQELQLALRDGFTTEEVSKAQQAWQQERQTTLGVESAWAAQLATGLYDQRDFAWLAEYDERIAQVTATSATQALRRYLGQAPIVWAIGQGTEAGAQSGSR